MGADPQGARTVQGEVERIGRFVVVGGTGFLVDAGILAMMTGFLGQGPFLGRAISVSLAVVATWVLNRTWAFQCTEQASLSEFARYVGSQGTGFSVNLIAYAALSILGPAPLNRPLVALAVASIVAMAVNYLGMRCFVFRPSEGVHRS